MGSRLRAAVCWNSNLSNMAAQGRRSRLRAAVCWNSAELYMSHDDIVQPPSGGCVLKQSLTGGKISRKQGSRLRAAVCWNKVAKYDQIPQSQAAAFGRLCVETTWDKLPPNAQAAQPPSGGCVLKLRLPVMNQI